MCQTVTFSYDTNTILPGFSANTNDRLATMSYSIRLSIGCEAVTEMYSYTPAGAMTKKRVRWVRAGQGLDLDAVYTYDTEGKVASVTYPGPYPGGKTLQNQYDSMGRLSVMREDLIRDGQMSFIEWANNAVYGPAGELKNLSWVVQAGSNRTTDPDQYTTETRTYNNRLQLTGLTAGTINLTYNYSATANNGQIVSMANNYSGETVTYAYDALTRLISASTNTGTWGQSFAYDGFGNMLNQTVTQGSAPSMTLNYDNSTNRISTPGYGYDTNGNMTLSPAFSASYAYDASNRMVTGASNNGVEHYGYAPDNKRMYKQTAAGEEQVHFYSGSQRLGIYKFQVDGGGVWSFVTVSTQKYFGGRKLETMDRLGSDVRGTKYFPYGAEATATVNEKDKFATYFRDSATGLDYADQRFYASTQGRFMSPDPYRASGGAADPGSWNRYAYVNGDPVRYNDPNGLNAMETVYALDGGGGAFNSSMSILDYFTAEGLFSVWFYQGTPGSGGGSGGGGSGGNNPPYRPECDRTTGTTNGNVIDFTRDHTAEAEQLAAATGIPSDFILAWAAYESGYGVSNKARVNNNFLGLTGGEGSWGGAIDCPKGASARFSCFEGGLGILPSVQAALFTPWSTHDYMGAAFVAANAGGSVAAIANAIAAAGFNSEYVNGGYGTKVGETAAAIAKRKDCP